MFLAISWLGSLRSRASVVDGESWPEAALLTSLQPPDRNRTLSFFPPECLGLHGVHLHFPLVEVRESFRPPREGQLPGGAARLPASTACLPASAAGSSDLHPSCPLSSFQVRSQRFTWLCDSHLCHGKVITNSFTAHVSLDCGLKGASVQSTPASWFLHCLNPVCLVLSDCYSVWLTSAGVGWAKTNHWHHTALERDFCLLH